MIGLRFLCWKPVALDDAVSISELWDGVEAMGFGQH